jgi:DNA-binding beta-propeller fold protein YncE
MHTRIKYPLAGAVAAGALAALSMTMAGCAAPGVSGAPAAAARPAGGPVLAYILSTPPCMGNTVSVINTATNTALKPITVQRGVNAIAVTPDGKTVYVTTGARITSGTVCSSLGPQTGTNKVIPISTATDKPGKPIDAGKAPVAIAVTPDGKTVYVLSQLGVVPIRTATGKPGKPVNAGKDPDAIAITPDGRTAYVVSADSGTVTPIRTATNTALEPVKVANVSGNIAITPDGRTAYVTAGQYVVPIRTATNTALQPVKVGPGPSAIVITPNSETVYVSTAAAVVPIRTATNTALRPVKVYSGPLAITPDGKTVYVVGLNTAPYRWEVTPIRTATNTALKPVLISTPGALLDGIGITPDGSTAYLLNLVFEPGSFPGTVIPLRTATSTLGKPITVATAPGAIVFAR